MHIVIISGSARMGRQTPKAVKALEGEFNKRSEVSRLSIIDVKEYDFPIMYERLRHHPNPPEGLAECGALLEAADGIVIASPEYNGSYSPALKNTMDYFYKEYNRKPFGLTMVSGGSRGGIRASHDLQKLVLALKGYPMPYMFLVANVRSAIDSDGNIGNSKLKKSLVRFVDEFLWFTSAIVSHKERTND